MKWPLELFQSYKSHFRGLPYLFSDRISIIFIEVCPAYWLLLILLARFNCLHVWYKFRPSVSSVPEWRCSGRLVGLNIPTLLFVMKVWDQYPPRLYLSTCLAVSRWHILTCKLCVCLNVDIVFGPTLVLLLFLHNVSEQGHIIKLSFPKQHSSREFTNNTSFFSTLLSNSPQYTEEPMSDVVLLFSDVTDFIWPNRNI